MASRKKSEAVPVDFSPVERKATKRGRKAIEKPGMKALVENWSRFKVGSTIVLPDFEGKPEHAEVSLARHHFAKYAKEAGLKAGTNYSIETHPDHGATITRLS